MRRPSPKCTGSHLLIVDGRTCKQTEIEPGRSVPADWESVLTETWADRKARRAAEALQRGGGAECLTTSGPSATSRTSATSPPSSSTAALSAPYGATSRKLEIPKSRQPRSPGR